MVFEKADHSITREEVNKTLMKLKARKTAELVEVAMEYLKLEGNKCSEWLFSVFDVCLNVRRVSVNWMVPYIVPINNKKC